MLCLPLDNVPSWVRHHAGEAWSCYSEFRAHGGTQYCPELDKPAGVCERIARMPEGLRDRLDPVFVGLEREADPEDFFRIWFAALQRNFINILEAAKEASASDTVKRLRLSQQAVLDTAPEFSQFFDSLRDFIGASACKAGSWRQGDSWRAEWR
mgnify:CR=1 FL=1